MKRFISAILTVLLLLPCIALVSCGGGTSSVTTSAGTGVVIVATSDGSAEILKAKLEAKTGETVKIVSNDQVGNDFAIVIDRLGADGFDGYGWSVNGNRLYINSNVLTDFEAVADAFASKISTLESIKTVPTATLKTEAENSIFERTEGMALAVDQIAAQYKESVLSAKPFDTSDIDGMIYYVSNNGSDQNDGKSPETAWATLDKVNSSAIKGGDAVLFECGSLFRGTISTVSNVTYASYGEGQKPIIIQSKRNYASEGLWELYDAENDIWKLTVHVEDPGIIVFNAHHDAIDCYGEITATRLWNTEDDDASRVPYSELLTADDLTYYWGVPTNTWSKFSQYNKENALYLRSSKDPNTEYDSIEIGEDIKMVAVGSNSGVTIDGICFKYGGGHCVSGSTFVEDLTVRNCVFAWIGGGLLNGSLLSNQSSRYGNAIEIFGGCNGFEVYNNWIYEIFDTGVTFQYHYSSGSTKMINIDIYNNLVERSYWCFEWWINPKEKAEKNPEVADVYVHDNVVREGFDSWGTMQHNNPQWGAMLSSGFGTSNLSNFKIENNIFDRTLISGEPDVTTRMLVISIGSGNENIEYTGNVFIQHKNQYIARINIDGTNVQFKTTKTQIKRLLSLVSENSNCDLSGNFFCTVEDSQ